MIAQNLNPKSRTRRRFLLASSTLALSLGGLAAINRNNNAKPMHHTNSSALGVIVDTIVPSGILNNEQPGALDIGIDKTLEAIANKKPKFKAQLGRVTQQVNEEALRQYQSPLLALDIDQRETLLSALLTQTQRQPLRVGLMTIRNSVLNLYYSNSAGHKVLGYTLPAHYPNY